MSVSREDKIKLVKQIQIANPSWGRRKVGAQLQSELGVGLRQSTITQILKETPVAVTERRPSTKTLLQDEMSRSGFISFEVYGVTGSPARAVGDIEPDSDHKLFQQTMIRMIRFRSREYQSFKTAAANRGWSPAKTTNRWRKRVLRHYTSSDFPGARGPTKGGGSFRTAEGKPSPWALYKAFEAAVIKSDPLGGDGWGTPRPKKGMGKKQPPVRTVDTAKINGEIAGHQRRVDSMRMSLKHYTDTADRKRLDTRIKEQLDTISKLREKL